ncbi:hypothetical protein EVAR_85241_1 [Eumeta japonica]|uniref:Uncharacterized protein n=1 Tax=Eumeta variegata TaxID=151549 RepID=A0A4C1W1U5_EUMVA|nr:hypothetical protein EVAR_85241_1 [Eumeta japonica]
MRLVSPQLSHGGFSYGGGGSASERREYTARDQHELALHHALHSGDDPANSGIDDTTGFMTDLPLLKSSVTRKEKMSAYRITLLSVRPSVCQHPLSRKRVEVLETEFPKKARKKLRDSIHELFIIRTCKFVRNPRFLLIGYLRQRRLKGDRRRRRFGDGIANKIGIGGVKYTPPRDGLTSGARPESIIDIEGRAGIAIETETKNGITVDRVLSPYERVPRAGHYNDNGVRAARFVWGVALNFWGVIVNIRKYG